jgi:heme a synthase
MSPTLPATVLYDLSPLVRILLTGLLLSAGPLSWVWLRGRHGGPAQRLRVLALVTLFLTFDLVLFGAFTRLTDSGLGCPDWPGCYGHASPIGAHDPIEAAQAVMPSGPVTPTKAWIEMIHRYLATGVGALIFFLAVASWRARLRGSQTRAPHGRYGAGESGSGLPGAVGNASVYWPTFTLVWVCLQGAFGALTVTMKLFPAIVTLHLLGGLVLLALLKVQTLRHAAAQGQLVPTLLQRKSRTLVLVTFGLLWLQIALGGWVSTNYAVLACSGFPSCQGSWWPAMDFRQGFTLWRALGEGADGGNISFQALTAIHYVHRLGACAVSAALLALSGLLYRIPSLRSQGRWLGALALLQVGTGLGNVVLGWPLVAAVGHTGGAAALVVVMTGIVFSTRARLDEAAGTDRSKLSASRLHA